MTEPRFMVVGSSGMIGANLVRCLKASGNEIIVCSRRIPPAGPAALTLDLSTDVSDWMVPPDISTCWFLAGETSLKRCEEDPRGTFKINVENTVRFLEKILQKGIFVVFPSSQRVFSGRNPFPGEDDAPEGITEYGRQKRKVEEFLQSFPGQTGILRLTKVIAPDSGPWKGWIESIKTGRPVYASALQVLAPVSVSLASTALARFGLEGMAGLFHLSATEEISYFAAMKYIASRLNLLAQLARPAENEEQDASFFQAHATLGMQRLVGLPWFHPPSPWEALDILL